MKNYMLRSFDSYILPREVYYQCIWLIKDMERLQDLKRDVGRSSVGIAATKRLDAIDRALEELPDVYREPMIRNIINKEEFPETAHENTWRKWKQLFIYQLAVNLELV